MSTYLISLEILEIFAFSGYSYQIKKPRAQDT